MSKKCKSRCRLIDDIRSISLTGGKNAPKLNKKQKINLPQSKVSEGFYGITPELKEREREIRNIFGQNFRENQNKFDRRNGVYNSDLKNTEMTEIRLLNCSTSLYHAGDFISKNIFDSCYDDTDVESSDYTSFGLQKKKQTGGMKRFRNFNETKTTEQIFQNEKKSFKNNVKTFSSHSSTSITTSSSFPSYPLNLPEIVSSSLFLTQSSSVRLLYGFSDTAIYDATPVNGPIYGQNGENNGIRGNSPELFFKMAVCSGSSRSGVWCDKDDFIVNMCRSLLADRNKVESSVGNYGINNNDNYNNNGSSSNNHDDKKNNNDDNNHDDNYDDNNNNIYNDKNIYLSRQYVSCHTDRTGHTENRFSNVSVVDICGAKENLKKNEKNDNNYNNNDYNTNNDNSNNSNSIYKKNKDENATQGSQAILIILPAEGWTDQEPAGMP